MANDDVTLKIKLDDEASSKIADIASSTEEMANEAEESGKKFSLSFTEINQAVELVTKAINLASGAAKTLYRVAREGTVDVDLTIAAAKRFGDASLAMREFQEATNFTRTGTQLLQFGNRLNDFGLNVHEVSQMMKLAKISARDLGISFNETQRRLEGAIQSGRLTGFRRAFGKTVDSIHEYIKAYEKTNGTLNQYQRSQMVVNQLVERSNSIIKEAGGTLSAHTDKYDKVIAAYGDVEAAIANFTDRIFEAADKSDVLERGLRAIEKAILAIDSKPIEQLADWLNTAIEHASHLPGFLENFFVDESDKINDALKSLGIDREKELKKWRDDVAKHGREYFGFASQEEEERAFKEFRDNLDSRGQLEIDRQRYWAKQIEQQERSLSDQRLENMKREAKEKDRITGVKKAVKGGGLKALADMLAEREMKMERERLKERIRISKEELDYNEKIAVEKERLQDEHNERMRSKAEEAAREQLKINQQFGQIVIGLGTSSLQNMSFMLGELAAGAEFSANAMVANLLDLLGNFAIQVGTLALAMGPVYSALFSLNPAAAIATGVILLAVGSALKGYAAQLKQSVAGAAGGAIGTRS